ncbi:MAG: preprotein translocase subunit SecE [Candidatus Andersenbacteria bacterium]
MVKIAYPALSKLSRGPYAIMQFFSEARGELKKVSWPSRETTIRYTILVIITCLILGFITGGIDYLLTLIINALI